MLAWLRRVFGTPASRDRAADDTDDTDNDDDDTDDNDSVDAAEGVDAALTDELDLHTFQPRECADVVAEYIRAAREAGFVDVRVIHGKGKGVLRRIVHGVLEHHPDVESFQLADGRSGSWGATLVRIKPRAS